jgi:multiple sugar transport system ATP-binding protein
MGFALRIAGVKKKEIRARVADAARILDLTPYLNRRPKELSGGQRQRVAMGRAIVRNPQAFLMDEPLSNLDARLREATRRELAALIRQIGATALFVTHDQVEALSLADRVAVMDRGHIIQEGAPAEVYGRPNSLFVAQFLGAANQLGARVAARTPEGQVRVRLDCNGRTLTLAGEGDVGEAVDVVLRPENLALATAPPASGTEAIPGKILSAAFQGAGVEYEVDIGGAALRAMSPAPAQSAAGATVWLAVVPSGRAVFRRDAL